MQREAVRVQPRRALRRIAPILIQLGQHRLVQFGEPGQAQFAGVVFAQQPGGLRVSDDLTPVIEQRQLRAGEEATGGQRGGEVAQSEIGAHHRHAGRSATRQRNAHLAGREKQVGVGSNPLGPGLR